MFRLPSDRLGEAIAILGQHKYFANGTPLRWRLPRRGCSVAGVPTAAESKGSLGSEGEHPMSANLCEEPAPRMEAWPIAAAENTDHMVAVIAIDRSARITFVNENAERLFGVGVAELRGRRVLEAAVSPSLCTLIACALVHSGTHEAPVRLPDGGQFRVRARAEALLDEESKGVGGVLILTGRTAQVGGEPSRIRPKG